MTWVLWDIFVPLLLSFVLGATFGWYAWGRGWIGRGQTQEVLETAGAGAAISIADSEIHSAVDDQDTEGLESANIVLIQERDRAINELDDVRAQNDALQTQIEELSNSEPVSAAHDEHSDDALQSVRLAEESKRQAEQLLEMEQKLEQVTVACQEERKAKRELELELLNTRNRCEKLETQNLAIAESDQSAESNQAHADQQAETLRTEFEALEVNHAKLQAEFEQQKHSVLNARQSSEEKASEIETLKTDIESLRRANEEPSKVIERHKQEISEQSEKIEQLEKQLLEKNSMLSQPEPVQVIEASSLQPVKAELESVEADLTIQNSVEQKSSLKPKAKVTDKKASKATSSGYVPKSWSIPQTRPGKKERDDLTDIKGVGPVLEKLLHEAGIFYFRQVALLDKNGVTELQQQISQFPDRIRRDQWVKQAKKLHRIKYGEAAKEMA